MILFVHMLFGAAIGSVVRSIPLAIILAFLGHYFLDIFPHIEYLKSTEDSIKKIKNEKWQKYLPDILKVFLDFYLGMLTILILSRNQPMIYIGAFFGILPDGLTVISSLLPRFRNPASRGFLATLNKFLSEHDKLHKKIHFLKNKKISKLWRIVTQVLAVIISIILLT